MLSDGKAKQLSLGESKPVAGEGVRRSASLLPARPSAVGGEGELEQDVHGGVGGDDNLFRELVLLPENGIKCGLGLCGGHEASVELEDEEEEHGGN